MSEQTHEPSKPKKRRRKPVHPVLHMIGVVVVVLLFCWLSVTQTGVLGTLVIPQVEAVLPCEVRNGRVTMTPSGDFVVRDLVLRMRGVPGRAGEFLTSRQLVIRIDWIALTAGALRIRELEFREPLVRISTTPEMELNVAALGAAGGAPGGIPTVRVEQGTVELGEHQEAVYAELVSMPVSGEFRAQTAAGSVYSFRLEERVPRSEGPRTPMKITGVVDSATLDAHVELRDFDISRWPTFPAPRDVREVWARMNVEGVISEANFSYTKIEGPVAQFELQDVRLNVPLPADEQGRATYAATRGRTPQFLRMSDVSGTLSFRRSGLRAGLEGLIEDLPCAVTLRMREAQPHAALDCTIRAEDFTVAERPGLLPFAPEEVKTIFRKFSGPTAEVRGNVHLSRAGPVNGEPAPFAVSGALFFENGTASYEPFPYPFEEIRGVVGFDETEIDIVQITGRGPTGAKLLAHGRIAPPGELAEVELDITVADLPIDDVFRTALRDRHSTIVSSLFDLGAYEAMVRSGLILPRERRDALVSERRALEAAVESGHAGESRDRRLREIDEALSRPGFDIAGVADLFVRVSREYGENTGFKPEITLDVHRAGIVPSHFPYPTIAENVHIRIDDQSATVEAPVLRGLTGAVGSLHADVSYGGDSYVPSIYIDASSIPVDDLLIQALPGGRELYLNREAASDGVYSAARLIHRLGLDGEVTCDAVIGPSAPGNAEYMAKVRFDDLRLRPSPDSLAIEGLAGRLTVSDRGIDAPEVTGRIGEHPVTLSFSTERAGGADSLAAAVAIEDLDLASPFAPLVGAFSARAGEQVEALRREFDLSGSVDVGVLVEGERESVSYRIDLSDFRGLRLRALDGELALRDAAGGLAFEDGAVLFEEFGAEVSFEGERAGRLRAGGRWASEWSDAETDVEIALEGARVRSALLGSLLGEAAPDAAGLVDEHDVRGVVSAGVVARGGPGKARIVETWIEPSRLSFERSGRRIQFHTMEGRVSDGADGGRVEGLAALADDWKIEADGYWFAGEQPGLDVQLGLEGARIGDELLAFLPEGVSSALRAIELETPDGFVLDDAHLTLRRLSAGHGWDTMFAGRLATRDAALSVGVDFEGIDGESLILFRRAPGRGARLEVDVEAERFRVATVPMSNGRVGVIYDEEAGLTRVSDFRADLQGGAVTCEAEVETGRAGGEARGYRVELSMAGVDFGRFIESMREGAAPADGAPPGERGRLESSLTITGELGNPGARLGRGIIRVDGGDVLNIPGIVPLVRLSNLQPPIEEKLDFAYADLTILGDTIAVTEAEVISPSFTIVGSGVVRLPELELDLRFNSRSRRRVLLLTDLLEGVRNELITTVVRGTIRDPEFSYEQLGGTRRIIGAMLGSPDDPDAVGSAVSPGQQ